MWYEKFAIRTIPGNFQAFWNKITNFGQDSSKRLHLSFKISRNSERAARNSQIAITSVESLYSGANIKLLSESCPTKIWTDLLKILYGKIVWENAMETQPFVPGASARKINYTHFINSNAFACLLIWLNDWIIRSTFRNEVSIFFYQFRELDSQSRWLLADILRKNGYLTNSCWVRESIDLKSYRSLAHSI